MPSCKCGKDMFPFGSRDESTRWICLNCDKIVTLNRSTNTIIWGTHSELDVKVLDYNEVIPNESTSQKPKEMGRSNKIRK